MGKEFRQYCWLALALLAGVPTACDRNGAEQPATDVTTLQVWAHAGQAAERDTLQQQVARFNQQHPGIQIQLTFIPERAYNAQVQAAAIAGDLPDVLEFDGPYLYNYVWQGHLIPLDDLLNADLQADLLPSIRARPSCSTICCGEAQRSLPRTVCGSTESTKGPEADSTLSTATM